MKFKRLLAALISTVMIAGMFPAFVFADETEATPAETVETRITETKETEEKEAESCTFQGHDCQQCKGHSEIQSCKS